MTVHIRLFTVLRDLAGGSEIDLELPEGSRLRDLIRVLQDPPHGELGRFITDETGQLKPYVKIVKHGNLQPWDDAAPLEDGGDYELFVLSSGG